MSTQRAYISPASPFALVVFPTTDGRFVAKVIDYSVPEVVFHKAFNTAEEAKSAGKDGAKKHALDKLAFALENLSWTSAEVHDEL